METKSESPARREMSETTTTAKRQEAIGWGAALLWIGVSALLNLGWPLVLLGLGVLTLAMQARRVTSGLRVEPFWLVLGAVFLVTGGWELISGTSFPLVPVAFIIAGLALLGTVLFQKPKGSD